MIEQPQLWNAGTVRPSRGQASRNARRRLNDDCLYPHLQASTAYQRGCMCPRCRDPEQREDRGLCAVDGCTNIRSGRGKQRYCARHAGGPDALPRRSLVPCSNAWCDRLTRVPPNYKTSPVWRVVTQFCDHCRHRLPGLQTLRAHNVPPDRLEQWLRTEHLGCAVCAAEFDEHTRPAIDHNHRCCAGRESTCGECIRGLLCNRCNLTAGWIDRAVNDGTLDALLTYLGHTR